MTEKDYSGTTTSKIGKNAKSREATSKKQLGVLDKVKEKKQEKESESSSILSKQQVENYKKAGEIAKKVKAYAKTIIKKDEKLSEIAEKIEAEILKLGGEIAFPANLSVDDVAAHYTPTLRDEKLATGLLKVDMGIHVDGCIADIAFSLDLTSDKKYSKLIEASEKALKTALEEVKNRKENSALNEIGKKIKAEIQAYGFSPIINLSGHGLSEYDVHSGLTIPNYDNGNMKTLGEGAFAIEPFATTGAGMIYDGPGSNIYHITGTGQVRDNFSREILEFIFEEKKTLPFSQRELERKFGSRAIIAIANLKRAGIIEEYSQLIEKNHAPVSQAETSLLVYNNKVEILVE